MTTTQIEGLHLHRDDFAGLFIAKHEANEALRDYAEQFARLALGGQWVDDPTGWLGWDVAPVYGPTGVLVALDFSAITHDDRSPGTRKTTRVEFSPKPARPSFTYTINESAVQGARRLCAESGETNPEYVRATAELLIDMTPGLTMDEHKDTLIAWLGS